MKLRKELDIPERDDEPDYTERELAEMRARHARMEQVTTQEEYVKLFNREYWNDRWLGDPKDDPGLLSTVPWKKAKPMSKKERKEENERTRQEWRAKYIPKKLKTIHLEKEVKESKTIRKLRKERKKAEERQAWQALHRTRTRKSSF